MAIKSEKISGKLILNEYDSTNLKSSEYNTETQELVVKFKKGGTNWCLYKNEKSRQPRFLLFKKYL